MQSSVPFLAIELSLFTQVIPPIVDRSGWALHLRFLALSLCLPHELREEGGSSSAWEMELIPCMEWLFLWWETQLLSCPGVSAGWAAASPRRAEVG